MNLSVSWAARLREVLVEAQRVELEFVRRQVRFTRQPAIRPFVIAVNYLGNGSLYLLIGLVLFMVDGQAFPMLAGSAALSAAVAHLIYPHLKRAIARPRPCEQCADLPPLLPTLDRFAFPSGHCMTMTAVAVPICVQLPQLAAPAAVLCALIGWARLAAAHHYPSDVVAGAIMGGGAALPVLLLLGI